MKKINESVRLARMWGRKIRLIDGSEGICNVAAVLRNKENGNVDIIPGCNIVTNAGDEYYAERGALETPNFTVAGLRLGTGVTSPTKTSTDVTTFLAGSGKAIDGTYPKTNDGDTDNTGAAVDSVTWRVSYTTAEANGANIAEGAIVDNLTTPTKALTHFLFSAAFTKTSNDTLKVFVNHNFLGS
jgi:hypothetical protein